MNAPPGPEPQRRLALAEDHCAVASDGVTGKTVR
jgi:hypothetical protein